MEFDKAVAGDLVAIESVLVEVSQRLRSRAAGFVRRNQSRLRSRTDADDLIQVLLLRVYESLGSGHWEGKTEEEFLAWARRKSAVVFRQFTKAASAAIRDSRKEAFSWDGYETAAHGAELAIPDDDSEAVELVAELFSRISREDDRTILQGIMDGLSYGDIAEGLGVDVSSVYWRVKYLRKVASRVQA